MRWGGRGRKFNNLPSKCIKISIRNFFANTLDTSFTETSKRVIMFSGNTQMMCSTQGFCKAKARFYKAFSHHHVPMMGLTHRDDGLDRRR